MQAQLVEHFAGFPLIAACALLAPCCTNAAAGGPLETAVTFLEATQTGRCDDAWRMYSARTQENIRAEVHRIEREREAAPQPESPARKYCFDNGTLKRESVRIARQQADEAVVTAEFVVRAPTSRYGLVPTTYVRTDELRLVREGAEWRIERPRVAIGRRHWRLTEVGPVDVFYQRSPLPRDMLEATVVVRTSRDALDAALRDATFWARALPSIKSVQSLERLGGLERVQLSFAGVDRSLIVAVQAPIVPTSTASEVAVIWQVEGGDKAPVYLRGSWRVRPYSDATRITLLLVFDRKQWPPDVAEGMFSAERMAQAVLSLEKAARK